MSRKDRNIANDILSVDVRVKNKNKMDHVLFEKPEIRKKRQRREQKRSEKLKSGEIGVNKRTQHRNYITKEELEEALNDQLLKEQKYISEEREKIINRIFELQRSIIPPVSISQEGKSAEEAAIEEIEEERELEEELKNDIELQDIRRQIQEQEQLIKAKDEYSKGIKYVGKDIDIISKILLGSKDKNRQRNIDKLFKANIPYEKMDLAIKRFNELKESSKDTIPKITDERIIELVRSELVGH